LSFSDFGLSAELLHAVESAGYTTPTPVQAQAIPRVLEGCDVLAAAQTGTGKTAGFMLPLLQHLQTGTTNRRRIRALVLTPTRELAAQVGESARELGQRLPFRTGVVYGGVSINTQIDRFRKGVDIVVATPGRLLDHLQQRTVDLSAVEVLVLDEADRMLDMGFIRDIRKIVKALPQERQTLLFSATFSKDIRRLANDFLRSPIEVGDPGTGEVAEGITQIVHPVDKQRKRELLSYRIASGNWSQVLVFTRTKHGANRLTKQLESDGLSAAAIHGNKSQAARLRALKAFKSGEVRVLVATDVAARGLDIERLPYVVNFELPFVAEDYVHRIGRTARAGLKGHAVSLVCVDELGLLKDIESLLGQKLQQTVIEGFKPDPRIQAEPISRGRGGGKPRQAPRQKSARSAGNAANNGKPRKKRRRRKRATGNA